MNKYYLVAAIVVAIIAIALTVLASVPPAAGS